MKITSLLAAVLLTACVIVPSVAGAVEIHFLCGQQHVTVDPENQKAFGYENKWEGGKQVSRVTINSEVYMAELLWPDGSDCDLLKLNRITGILTSCGWDSDRQRLNCNTSQCQKISGEPKF